MNLKQSFDRDFHQRTNANSSEKQEFLDSAFQNFISNAATFSSREEFNQHISELEKAYFRTTKIETTPYKSPRGKPLAPPSYPAKPTMS